VSPASDVQPAIDRATLRSGVASLECFVVPWDSEIFGFGVAEISRLDLPTGPDGSALFEAFDAWCAEREVRLVTCRLDHERLRDSMTLESNGFRFSEMVYTPRLEPIGEVSAPRIALDVAEADEGDIESIEDVARSAFTTGRYLLDHRLPSELNGRRYARWVRSAFESPTQQVIKAVHEGELVGFFCLEADQGDVYWHLTAVAPGWQGRGVGVSLWRTMLRRHAAEGARSVTTTISAHNLAVINLYVRLGFSFAAAQMTFHRLRESRE